MENKKKDHLGRNIFIVVTVLVSIVLIIGFAPVMSKAYSVSVTKPVQVSQPYTETVTVPVQVSQPYTVDVTDQAQTQQPLSYQVTSATIDPARTWGGVGPDCYWRLDVTVKNTDQQAGAFNVYFTYSSPSWVRHGEGSANIQPGEWQTVEFAPGLLSCDAITNWDYVVTPDTKTVTTSSTHQETRYRTVTEYQTRQETHYRTVTEYQTYNETGYRSVSVLKYLTD